MVTKIHFSRLLALALWGLAGSGIAQTVDIEPATPQQSRPDLRQAEQKLDVADKARRNGDNAAALRAIEEGLKVAPADLRLRFLKAVILSETGRDAEATTVFETLTQEFPEVAEPWNNVAVQYAKRGDLERAMKALQDALRVRPQYAVAQENMGDVHARMAHRAYEEARKMENAKPSANRSTVRLNALTNKLKLSQALLNQLPPLPPLPH